MMKGVPLTDELVDYMIDLYGVDDNLLGDIKREAVAAGIPEIQISPEQGAFMQVLLKGIGARRVLEIGTLAGYSAIVMARSLREDSELITLEREPRHAEFARRAIERAGLSHRVTVVEGPAAVSLEHGVVTGPFDFCFIDADKPGYTRYLELVLPLMRRGGLIAGDNALSHGRVTQSDPENEMVAGIQEFNRAMASHPGLQSCLVPISDGITLGVVL